MKFSYNTLICAVCVIGSAILDPKLLLATIPCFLISRSFDSVILFSNNIGELLDSIMTSIEDIDEEIEELDERINNCGPWY